MESLGETRALLDEQFDALADVERRRLLVSLSEGNPQDDTPIKIDEVEGTESPEWRIAMQHNHLPRLEDHGFVRWDRENSHVTKGPQFEKIEPLVALLNEHRDGL